MIENTRFFFLFYQFSGGMKYENRDSCPGHINVNVVDDRTQDDYSRWWVPSPQSDYLIHHFNHISLLPKMMTKLIILTSENFHNLALVYLILTLDASLICASSFSQLSFPAVIQTCHLCMSLPQCTAQAVLWTRGALLYSRKDLRSRFRQHVPRSSFPQQLCDIKHLIILNLSFLCCKMKGLCITVPSSVQYYLTTPFKNNTCPTHMLTCAHIHTFTQNSHPCMFNIC